MNRLICHERSAAGPGVGYQIEVASEADGAYQSGITHVSEHGKVLGFLSGGRHIVILSGFRLSLTAQVHKHIGVATFCSAAFFSIRIKPFASQVYF